MPSSAVMCSLREASASVIVLALKPYIASKGVHFIAELNAILQCASAIAGSKVILPISIQCIFTFREAAR